MDANGTSDAGVGFAGLVRSIQATTDAIFHAIGKPRIDTRWQVVRLSILAFFIYPFTIRAELTGASIAVFLSIFITNIGCSFEVVKITKCGIINFGKAIIFSLINGIVMVLSIFTLKIYIGTTGILNFVLLFGVGILIYLAMTYIFDKYLDYKMQSLIKESLISFGGS